MRTMKLVTLAVFTLLFATAPAHADINTLITFDDLAGNQGPIADGYMGLHWINFYFQNPLTFDNGDPLMVGYKNGVVSRPNIGYNGGGQDAIFYTDPGSTFTLTSAYFTSTAYWLNTAFVNVSGYLNGTLTHTQQVAINDAGPTLATFGWLVDGVGISTATPTAAGTDVAIDNLRLGTIPPPGPGPVPEPGAVFLLGAVGAALLPLLRRRFRHA